MSLDFYLETPTCPTCGHSAEVFDADITSNLGAMAREAGIYEALWHPNEHGYTTAKELIEPLRKGLDQLLGNPEYFKSFDAPNGWGLYEHFVPFVQRCLAACQEHPTAVVRTST
ncbi:MAG: hypothetical protein GY851_35545 [bacterium]|nr:hypothetical protein [bacterium]